uniref:Doublecortin domain-containing protein n=1 Tax=Heterorhabditis bacteriophora TaxID=37862 RepID=A0A1I7XSB7_HETBA
MSTGSATFLSGHVENSRLIYLHEEWMSNERVKIEDEIKRKLYVISLSGSFVHHPHPSETAILRKLLPHGTRVRFQVDKKSKKGTLISEDGLHDIRNELQECLEQMQIDVGCNAILPYSNRIAPTDLDGSFIHYLQCPTAFVKGTLQMVSL